MKTTAIFLTALAAAVALPAAAEARWYESPWFWGPTGLVVGGAAGYALGKDQARRSVPHHHHAPSPYYTGGPVYYTGGTYHRETRFWPFYRRTESYPIARTMPLVYQPQAVSLAHPVSTYHPHDVVYTGRSFGYDWDRRESDKPEPTQINVTIGDNNQDVVINVGGTETRAGKNSGEEWVTVPMENTVNGRLGVNGRMVDVRVNASDVARAVEQERNRREAETAPKPEETTPSETSEDETPEE